MIGNVMGPWGEVGGAEAKRHDLICWVNFSLPLKWRHSVFMKFSVPKINVEGDRASYTQNFFKLKKCPLSGWM